MSINKSSSVLFNNFLILWITSFVDDGTLADINEAKDIIATIFITYVITSFFFFRIAGTIADKHPSYVTLPLAFVFRASAIIWFLFIGTPKSLQFYFVCLLM